MARSAHVSRTSLYLKRPQMSSAFDVDVVVEDESNGRLVGPELDRISKLLRVSEGSPLFDLEFDGRLLARCRVKDIAASGGSIPFSYESTQLLDPPKSDPNPNYR